MMKYSRYNSMIKVSEDRTIIFNATNDKFMVLTSGFTLDFDNTKIDKLRNNNPALYNQLLETGIVIDQSVDEVAIVRDRIDRVDNDNSTLHLHINPTVDCNFRCWYCYEEHTKGSRMESEIVESIEKLLKRVVENPNIKKINLSFFGGEPLFYFESVAKRLISYLREITRNKEINHSIHFTTNAYLLNDRMIEFLSEINNCSFQITLDGHREEHNKVRKTSTGKGSYDKIVSNVIKLLRAKMRVVLRINYTSKNIESVKDIVSEFDYIDSEQRTFLSVDFQRVWQDKKRNESSEIAEAHTKLFKSLGYRVSNNKIIDYVNKPCYGDKRNHLLINYNGDLFKCTARDFVTENRAGYISSSGELVWENDYQNVWMSKKFSRPICFECRIAPLCGGGCRQQAFENKSNNGCLYNYSDEDKLRIVIDRFEHSFIN